MEKKNNRNDASTLSLGSNYDSLEANPELTFSMFAAHSPSC